MKNKMTVNMRHIYLFLLASLLIPVSAWGQDDRQRTVTTIVQDVLAQLPVQDKERFDREAGDIVSSAPVSVVILADMLHLLPKALITL